ncbi:MAG: Gfo/Idh/MocA family oxidoreductase [Verrucomicrobiae bacterium]
MTNDLSPAPIRLGIIGLGNMGAAHAGYILSGSVPGLQLSAVADINPARLEAYDGIAHFDDAQALIASGAVEAILIATPHYSHTPLGIAVLQAGLHLLVEKPISVHKKDCEELIAAYRPDSGQVFAAMFNQRTDPKYRKLKELIASGALGTIQRINWIITNWFRTEYYYQSGDWRATWAGEGGGVLLNQCPHNLDLWQWLFGMPDRIIARCQIGRFHEIEVEDSVTALFEYASGVQGVFVTTTGEAPGTNRLEVAGDNGKIIISPEHPDLIFTRNERSSSQFSKESSSGFASPDIWNVSVPVSGSNEQHVGILKNFVAAIRGEAPLIAPATEGIRSVELANAMLLSSFKDRPISLPLDADDYAAELGKKIAESTFAKTTAERTAPSGDFAKSF